MTFYCRAVLLDMDGTLVDSTAAVEAQWGRWAARHGVAVQDVLRIAHGRPSIETMRMLKPEAATEDEHERFMREEEEHEGGALAIPGALRFVQQLPPDRWAVVTSAPRGLALARLAGAGFPAPPVAIAQEDVNRGKPDPEPFLAAAARLGVAPASCVVVEDTPAGLAAATAAGMASIGITTTFTREQLGCCITISTFEGVAVERRDDELVLRLG